MNNDLFMNIRVILKRQYFTLYSKIEYLKKKMFVYLIIFYLYTYSKNDFILTIVSLVNITMRI